MLISLADTTYIQRPQTRADQIPSVTVEEQHSYSILSPFSLIQIQRDTEQTVFKIIGLTFKIAFAEYPKYMNKHGDE